VSTPSEPTPTNDQRDQMPPCSADSSRKVPGLPSASLRYTPIGRLAVGEELAQHRDDAVPAAIDASNSARDVVGVMVGSERRGRGVDVEAGVGAGVTGGPTCSTWTSSVSPSQSRRAPRTYCTLPLVSPLRQYSCRLRDQKVTRPW
jgi:hypothetical protein